MTRLQSKWVFSVELNYKIRKSEMKKKTIKENLILIWTNNFEKVDDNLVLVLVFSGFPPDCSWVSLRGK